MKYKYLDIYIIGVVELIETYLLTTTRILFQLFWNSELMIKNKIPPFLCMYKLEIVS